MLVRSRVARYVKNNLVAFLALFVALGGTSAYAVNTIGSTDIIDGEVKSVDIGNGEVNSADVKDQSLTTFDVSTFLGADVVDGTLTAADLATDSVGSSEVQFDSLTGEHIFNDSLTGADINEASLVGLEDGCPPTTGLYVNLCARGDGVGRLWIDALVFCRGLGLRLPGLGEAIALGALNDVPGVAPGESFWTEELSGTTTVYNATEEGGFGQISTSGTSGRTVCVTTPSSLYQ